MVNVTVLVMAMAAFVQFGKDLECSICLDQYAIPKLLTCMHTFCLKCISQLVPTKGPGPAVTCPQCRSITKVAIYICMCVLLFPLKLFVDLIL